MTPSSATVSYYAEKMAAVIATRNNHTREMCNVRSEIVDLENEIVKSRIERDILASDPARSESFKSTLAALREKNNKLTADLTQARETLYFMLKRDDYYLSKIAAYEAWNGRAAGSHNERYIFDGMPDITRLT